MEWGLGEMATGEAVSRGVISKQLAEDWGMWNGLEAGNRDAS